MNRHGATPEVEPPRRHAGSTAATPWSPPELPANRCTQLYSARSLFGVRAFSNPSARVPTYASNSDRTTPKFDCASGVRGSPRDTKQKSGVAPVAVGPTGVASWRLIRPVVAPVGGFVGWV